MNSLKRCFILLVPFFVAPVLLAQTPGDKPADDGTRAASSSATKQEVEQLRQEVAELKAAIQRLLLVNQQGTTAPRLVEVSAVQPGDQTVTTQAAPPPKQAPPKKEGEGLLAGFNGEHFFLKSSDGSFNIQPYGYVQTDYRAYNGDGHPPDTFTLRRGRFGFQAALGKHYDAYLLPTPTAPCCATSTSTSTTILPSRLPSASSKNRSAQKS